MFCGVQLKKVVINKNAFTRAGKYLLQSLFFLFNCRIFL